MDTHFVKFVAGDGRQIKGYRLFGEKEDTDKLSATAWLSIPVHFFPLPTRPLCPFSLFVSCLAMSFVSCLAMSFVSCLAMSFVSCLARPFVSCVVVSFGGFLVLCWDLTLCVLGGVGHSLVRSLLAVLFNVI